MAVAPPLGHRPNAASRTLFLPQENGFKHMASDPKVRATQEWLNVTYGTAELGVQAG